MHVKPKAQKKVDGLGYTSFNTKNIYTYIHTDKGVSQNTVQKTDRGSKSRKIDALRGGGWGRCGGGDVEERRLKGETSFKLRVETNGDEVGLKGRRGIFVHGCGVFLLLLLLLWIGFGRGREDVINGRPMDVNQQ